MIIRAIIALCSLSVAGYMVVVTAISPEKDRLGGYVMILAYLIGAVLAFTYKG